MKPIKPADVLMQHPCSALQQLATFGALSCESIQWLLNEGRLLQTTENEIIFEPGQPGNSFFVILDGDISYYRCQDKQDNFIRQYESGHEIGFVSTIALHERLGKAVTQNASLLLEIDTDMFNRFYEADPKSFGILLLNLSREMARTIGKMDAKINLLKSAH